MCRLLYIKSRHTFEIRPHLQIFAGIARNNKEYQGHGWGVSYLQQEQWIHYRNINPVWQDTLDQFGHTRVLLAHARSAFQNRSITVENNMPFYDQKYIYIFNGELHGVNINVEGRIGAEKIFNFIKRFDRGDMQEALTRAVPIIEKRSTYIRAMNIIIADKNTAYLSTMFNEKADYFTMHYKKTDDYLIICSEKYPGEHSWTALKNRSLEVFK